MNLLSALTRLTLIALILYGGYMVFAEQRTIRVCENEVKSIESSLEARIDPNSSNVVFCALSRDPLFFSWLYCAPPGKSFTLQIVTKRSGEPTEQTLLQVPSQTKRHYGIIDIQFNTEGTLPPLIKKMEVYGPNFLKSEYAAGDGSQFKAPRILGMAVSNKVNLFESVQNSLSRRLYFAVAKRDQSETLELEHSHSLVLCYFTEEEAAGLPLKHLDHVIRVVADE